MTGKSGLDLATENKILWHLIDLADECGIDFAQYFEDELDEFADEVRDMSYWQELVFCAGVQLHLFGDNLCQMKPYMDSLKKV